MTKLDEFEAELRVQIGQPSGVRPFVCDGSPLECKAMIVGFNPATSLDADFWNFWRPGHGFDRDTWFADYKTERQRRPLRPGKQSRPAVTNSRRVMNWIIQEAVPVPILETNIYAFPTEQAKDLTSEAKSTAPFHLLMKWIDPEVILVHGNEAQKYLKERGIGRFRIEVKHFSRGWSKDEAVAIGRRIKLTCLREA